MAPLLYHAPFMEHDGFVAEAAGGKTAADIDGCLVLHDFIEAGINLVFRHGVERGGRLIQ